MTALNLIAMIGRLLYAPFHNIAFALRKNIRNDSRLFLEVIAVSLAVGLLANYGLKCYYLYNANVPVALCIATIYICFIAGISALCELITRAAWGKPDTISPITSVFLLTVCSVGMLLVSDTAGKFLSTVFTLCAVICIAAASLKLALMFNNKLTPILDKD